MAEYKSLSDQLAEAWDRITAREARANPLFGEQNGSYQLVEGDQAPPEVRSAVEEFFSETDSQRVAKALAAQEADRAKSLDDLLDALNVDLLPWQRSSLHRWVEGRMTFRMK